MYILYIEPAPPHPPALLKGKERKREGKKEERGGGVKEGQWV
jgi:hypothetical protein